MRTLAFGLALLLLSLGLVGNGSAAHQPSAPLRNQGSSRSQGPGVAAAAAEMGVQSVSDPSIVVPQPMHLVATAPPTGGPPPDIVDISLKNPSQGVAVTGGMMLALPGGGLITQTPGRIVYTTDGGHAWTTVWQRASADFFWVGRSISGALWVASGLTVSTTSSTAQPLLMTSTDGHRWLMIHPRVPAAVLHDQMWQWLRFTFVSSTVGFAVSDPQETVGFGELLRTTDGGRRWSFVTLPGGQFGGGIAFSSATDGIASGAGQSCSVLWRTTDAGRVWVRIPGTCSYGSFDSIAFATPSLGYAGGGQSPKFGGFVTLWRTVDGGETWHQIYHRTGIGPIADLHAIGRTVWASVGACVMGQSGPCGGLLMVSHDEGHAFSQLPGGGNHVTVPTAQSAMWVQPFYGVLWRTDDGGAYSHPVASSQSLSILQVSTLGASDVELATNAGAMLSTDGGSHFLAEPTTVGGTEYMAGMKLSATPIGMNERISVRHGTARPLVTTLPAEGQDTAQFSMESGQSGVVVVGGSTCSVGPPSDAGVYVTRNGGAHWALLSRLPLAPQSVAFSGQTVSVLGLSDTCGEEMAISTSGGHQFSMIPISSALGCTATGTAGGTVWLLCFPSVNSGYSNTEILRSTDGGLVWTGFEARRFAAEFLAPVSSSTAYLNASGRLWVTHDAGRTLKEIWPPLPVGWR